MNRIFYILISVLSVMMLDACQKGEEPSDIAKAEIGAEVPDMYVEDNDPLTRTSLVYEKPNMKFEWQDDDKIGVFCISYEANTPGALNTQFDMVQGSGRHEGSSALARFVNNQYSFSTEQYWVAYSPYNCNLNSNGTRGKVLQYDDIMLSYEGQTQSSNATNGEQPTLIDPALWHELETKAAAHLGAYDYLISAPAKPQTENFAIFRFEHVGSTIRFYLRFPDGGFGGAGKTAEVESLELIYDGDGEPFASKVHLEILPYSESNTSSFRVKQGGLTLSKTQKLFFKTSEGKGIDVIDHGYFIAYMQFYPFSVEANSCHLFLTTKVDGKEKYFKSAPLPGKTIGAGVASQWSTGTFTEPIELTATIAPWEDVHGGTITTGE